MYLTEQTDFTIV